jgi:putative hydrolase of the HAD superfamily
MQKYESIIRHGTYPLAPLATEIEPRLPPLRAIRAVLFDIYGTLLVSAVGDIGLTDPKAKSAALVEATAAVGLQYSGDGHRGTACLHEVIDSFHRAALAAGCDYPEVDILHVWQATCRRLLEQGILRGPVVADGGLDVDLQRLAIEYEIRANPVWPMPGLRSCLQCLVGARQLLGIVSNAQFFTPLMFPPVAGASLDELGFDRQLRYYSYLFHQAKPGCRLFREAAIALSRRGVEPEEVLFVGNDIRNDIWPAAQVGFRTALFAGDARSLRLRDEDPDRNLYGQPDAVVTQLEQIPTMIVT